MVMRVFEPGPWLARRHEARPAEAVRVFVADEHRSLSRYSRSSLAAEPNVVVVGETGAFDDAALLARQLVPRIMVLAPASPDPSIVSTIRASRDAQPTPDVVLISSRLDEPYVRMTLEAGARGYVLPDDPDVGRAVRAVASGGAYFSPDVATVVRHGYLRRGSVPIDALLRGLTDLERSILTDLVRGWTLDEIGAELGMTAAALVACRHRIADILASHDGAGLPSHVV
jgi:DNA-binding NarL/FixJ family response regulator